MWKESEGGKYLSIFNDKDISEYPLYYKRAKGRENQNGSDSLFVLDLLQTPVRRCKQEVQTHLPQVAITDAWKRRLRCNFRFWLSNHGDWNRSMHLCICGSCRWLAFEGETGNTGVASGRVCLNINEEQGFWANCFLYNSEHTSKELPPTGARAFY